MSVVPSDLGGGGGKKRTVTIFGRQVSTDALLLAGASVVAILLLYRAGKPAASGAPLFGAPAGDGSRLAGLPTNDLIASTPPPDSRGPINLKDWTMSGSGFEYAPGGVDTPFVSGSRKFFHLTDYGAVQAYLSQGGQVYFSPAPGVFVPTSYGQAAPGTPAYGVIGSNI